LSIKFLGDGDYSFQAQKVGKVLGFQTYIQDHLQEAHWIIASSYLSILDSLAAGRQVFSLYSNPLKKDYLTTYPAATSLSISSSPEELASNFLKEYQQTKPHAQLINTAHNWALDQTWKKLTDQYIKLWTSKTPQLTFESL
jgi:hypothetical protein